MKPLNFLRLKFGTINRFQRFQINENDQRMLSIRFDGYVLKIRCMNNFEKKN